MSDLDKHLSADVAEARRLVQSARSQGVSTPGRVVAIAQVFATLAVAEELARMNRIRLGGKP